MDTCGNPMSDLCVLYFKEEIESCEGGGDKNGGACGLPIKPKTCLLLGSGRLKCLLLTSGETFLADLYI